MPRIRSIKPDFFRHDVLQELEEAHPKSHPMLVFAGLWTQADKNGVFQWRPKYLKLDILPFINYDISKTLDILASAKLILRFSSDGDEYGWVVSFEKHQRITGKEATDGGRYPQYNGETCEHIQGNIGEATEKQPVAQEREREREREVGEIVPSGKPKKRSGPLLVDEEWISQLKANPAYSGIDIDRELGKMRAWLTTPRGAGKTMTRQRVINWMNRAEPSGVGKPSLASVGAERDLAKESEQWLLDNGYVDMTHEAKA
jgi:hypothetical protein